MPGTIYGRPVCIRRHESAQNGKLRGVYAMLLSSRAIITFPLEFRNPFGFCAYAGNGFSRLADQNRRTTTTTSSSRLAVVPETDVHRSRNRDYRPRHRHGARCLVSDADNARQAYVVAPETRESPSGRVLPEFKAAFTCGLLGRARGARGSLADLTCLRIR